MERQQRNHRRKIRLVQRALGAFIVTAAVFLLVSHMLSGDSDTLAARKTELPPAFQGELNGSEEPSEAAVRQCLSQLEIQFPSGRYWNHIGYDLSEGEKSCNIVTDIPCDHDADGAGSCNTYHGATDDLFPFYNGIQCLGFASMLSDRIFGTDAPVTVYRDYDRIRLGDQIRLTGERHSMLVTEKSETGVAVAEVNADYNTCAISWGREISREQLESYGEEIEYLTRYSKDNESASGNGSDTFSSAAPQEELSEYRLEIPGEPPDAGETEDGE